MSSKVFAGIGARKTPNTEEMPIGKLMGLVANKLCLEQGWVMTSGGAEGADGFFQAGLEDDKRDAYEEGLFKVYLPWAGFNNQRRGIVMKNPELLDRARQILIDNNVYDKVPRFISLQGKARDKLTEREKTIAELHTRNVFQVLQSDLRSPVNMVICWTPDGATSRKDYKLGVTGGTGIAINLADAYGIQVFNLNRLDHLERICNFIGVGVPSLRDQIPNRPPQPSLF
jgi:hypothetical protein